MADYEKCPRCSSHAYSCHQTCNTWVFQCLDCGGLVNVPIDKSSPAYQWTLQDLMQLPPCDPRRASFILAYLRGGAGAGIGQFEWETIHGALEIAAAGPTKPV